jgi:hypothetical protein
LQRAPKCGFQPKVWAKPGNCFPRPSS